MTAQLTFLGEIELAGDLVPTKGFGAFNELPNIGLVRELAHQFRESIELMPYQKVGDVRRLLICAYLEASVGGGQLIAVLGREEYPATLSGLVALLENAIRRLELLDQPGSEFRRGSLDAARTSLASLTKKIAAS